MKQIIVRRMTLADYICNVFFKVRFWCYRNFFKSKLKNTSPEEKNGKEITFIDNFDEVSWSGNKDTSKWMWGEGWGQFHPDKPSVYYGPPELIDGTSLAKFTVKYNPKTFPDDHRTGNPITIPFQVSLISTQKSFRQQYGRWECRCTLPMDPAVWPAFWMWGSTWPPEIDVFETYGGKDGKKGGVQCINLHFGNTKDGTKGSTRSWDVKIQRKMKQQFHEFVCEWGPDKIEFFTDGVKIYRFTNKKTLKWFNDSIAQMWVVVNHSLQEKYLKETNGEQTIDFEVTPDFYSEYLVDYVRAYKNK